MVRVAPILLIFLLLGSASAAPAGTAAQGPAACPDGNLLGAERIVRSFGVIREQRLLDGRTPGENADIDDYSAALFIERGAYLLFDLGGMHGIAAVDTVTDDYESPLLEWSADGISFSPVPLENSKQLRSHIRQRWSAGLALKARYLRLHPDTTRRARAVAELRVFCRVPAGFPDLPALREAGSFKADIEILQNRNKALNLAYFAIVVSSALLVVWMKRLDARKRNSLALLILVAGSAGWIRFGYFAGAGELLHPHEATHYYLGAKYFRELGYRELYRCIARSEQENGRGFMVDRVEVRDLDNYASHPGTWTRLEEGRCRADFSQERWQAFKADVDRMRRLFVRRHFHGILKDHGYNATPLHTTWLEAATNALPGSRGPLYFFALLDIAMTVAAIALMWWGFGPVAGSVAALVLGFSDLSSYDWIGGSLGRSVWLLSLCAGAACLKRRKPAAGAALVTLAALLRLIPVVFVGLLGLHVLVRLLERRRFDKEDRHIVGGMAVMLAIGLLAPLVAFGPEIYPAFYANTVVHAGNVSVNQLGLGTVLKAMGSPDWLRLSAKVVAVMLGILFIAHLVRLKRPLWSVLPVGGLLIFGALGLGYDYAWLVILAPFAEVSTAAGLLLLGFVAATNLSSILLPARESFILLSVALLAILPAIVYLGQKAIGPVFSRNRGE